MGSHSLIGLLSRPERLRVVAAVALGARTVTEVAERTGQPQPEVVRILRRFESAGLVSLDGTKVTLHEDLFERVVREEAEREPPEDFGEVSPETAAILRAFVRRGRLTEIPATRTKRWVVLEYLAADFEPGESYPEPEVNEMLREWYPDHAALRRYLVDAGLLARDSGIYRRSGGSMHRPSPHVLREQQVEVYGLAEDGPRVLLVRDEDSRWALPGGSVEFGELPAEALVRTVREQTGHPARAGEVLDADAGRVRFRRDGQRVERHSVRLLFRISIGDPPGAAEWVDREELSGRVLAPYVESVLLS